MMRALVSAIFLLAICYSRSTASPITGEVFDCVMNPQAKVRIGAAATGVLQHVYVNRGDRIVSGQPLAQFVAAVEEAGAAAAKLRAENDSALKVNQVRLDFARRKLARLQRLRATGTANERQLDEATSEFRIAELALAEATFAQLAAGEDARRAQALLTQRLILSPLSGVVVERHMLAGEFVSDRTPIMTVASIDVLHVEVDVPVMYYGQIAINKRATVFVDAPFTGQKDATVIAFDQILNSGTGMFGVRLQVENSELSLPAGGRCRIRFETISAAAPAVD